VRAAVLHKVMPIEQKPLTIEDVPVPAVGRGQVVIKA